MSDYLQQLLLRMERPCPALVSREEIEDWPDSFFGWCCETGVLREAPVPQELICRECAEQPLIEIVYLGDRSSGQAQACLPCPFCGPVLIPPDRLKQWHVDFKRLLDLAVSPRLSRNECCELMPKRLWQLGRIRLQGGIAMVAAARALHLRDGAEILRSAKLPPRSMVLVPALLPRASAVGEPSQLVVPLRSVLSWHGGQLVLDDATFDGSLPSEPQHLKRAVRSSRKRAARAATIEALTQHLKDHVRAARDHARVTAERHGLPELLPRPAQRDLALLAGVSEVAVSRCLRDRSASELRLLWEVAGDLDRLMSLRLRG